MNKTTVIAVIITSVFLVSLVAVLFVNVTEANPFSFFWTYIDPIPGTIPPTLTVFSPQNNTHYTSNSIIFSFNASKPQAPIPVEYANVERVVYYLDTISGLTVYSHNSGDLPDCSYSGYLTLPEGNHSITVCSQGYVVPGNMTVFSMWSNSTVYFTIDTALPTLTAMPTSTPSTDSIHFIDSDVTIFSPINMTYNHRNLILHLTVPVWSMMGMPTNVSMNYSIDGSYNGSIPLKTITHPDAPPIATKVGYGAGSVDLPELPNGSHYLTIYLYGLNMQNYQPQFKSYVNTVYFSIEDPNSIFIPTPTPTSVPTPTLTPSPSPSLAPSPSLPEFTSWVILPLVVIVGTALVALRCYRRR